MSIVNNKSLLLSTSVNQEFTKLLYLNGCEYLAAFLYVMDGMMTNHPAGLMK